MRFLTWLGARSPSITDMPPPLPPAVPPLPPLSEAALASHEAEILSQEGEEGHDTEQSGNAATAVRIDLEPVSTIIDYTDSGGQKTRRRITFRALSVQPTGVLLRATCHERRAARAFRTDRIDWIIDDDGVATTCADFFRSVMDIDLAALAQPIATTTPDRDLAAARLIRDKLRPEVAILVAVARADGHFHDAELDVIMHYAEDRVLDLIDDCIIPDTVRIATLDHLGRIIAKMRPSRESLPGYLATVAERGAAGIISTAMAHIVQADGKLLLAEIEMIEELEELANLNLAQIEGTFGRW